MLPTILVIVGPTASGKTTLTLEIGTRRPAEVVSADSRQVYRFLTIGTAKPTAEQRRILPHHFVDILDPREHFSAGDFAREGRQVIAEILRRGRLPIVVGGTGLYVQALVDGLFSGPGMKEEIRAELEGRLQSQGARELREELRRVDPKSAAKMLPSQSRRIIRALEVFYATGKPISKHHEEQKRVKAFDAHFVGLRWDRARLYERINARVDGMLADGFIEEVRDILSKGYDDRCKSLQTVGYKEAIAFLKGEISHEMMVELMKRNTRRFAKRQLTWFRRDKRIRWYDISREEEIHRIASEVLEVVLHQ